MMVFDQQDEGRLAARMAETAAAERRLAVRRDGSYTVGSGGTIAAAERNRTRGRALEALILQHIAAGKVRVPEIATVVQRSRHTVYDRLADMQSRGLVQREKCPRFHVWLWSLPAGVGAKAAPGVVAMCRPNNRGARDAR